MKVVYDTCLYIDFLRHGKYHEIFLDRSHLRYLSSIVVMELLAGAVDVRQKRVVERLISPYEKAGRLITPTAPMYHEAGSALAKIRSKTGPLSQGFSHDLLIAISARAIGATLYTANQSDFIKISPVVTVQTVYF